MDVGYRNPHIAVDFVEEVDLFKEEFLTLVNPRVDVVDLKDITKMELILAKDNEDVDDDVCIFAMCLSDGMMIESLADADALALEIAPSLFEDNGPHPLTACQTVITRAAQAWDKRNKGKFRDDITLAVSILRTPGDTVLL